MCRVRIEVTEMARPIPERKTASTHVIDPEGKLYRVHDGTPTKTVVFLDGNPQVNLTYVEARKAKEQAVHKLKCRTATIEEHAVRADSFVPPNKPNPDPQLERARQAAVRAVAPVAQQAQTRAAAVVQRAPGWEPPPPGVSSALDLPDDDGDIEGDVDGDVSDLLVSDDLESEVKAETERAHAAAKSLWDALGPATQAIMTAHIKAVVDDAVRADLYASWTPEQIVEFQNHEIAYHLLFGLPEAKP